MVFILASLINLNIIEQINLLARVVERTIILYKEFIEERVVIVQIVEIQAFFVIALDHSVNIFYRKLKVAADMAFERGPERDLHCLNRPG